MAGNLKILLPHGQVTERIPDKTHRLLTDCVIPPLPFRLDQRNRPGRETRPGSEWAPVAKGPSRKISNRGNSREDRPKCKSGISRTATDPRWTKWDAASRTKRGDNWQTPCCQRDPKKMPLWTAKSRKSLRVMRWQV